MSDSDGRWSAVRIPSGIPSVDRLVSIAPSVSVGCLSARRGSGGPVAWHLRVLGELCLAADVWGNAPISPHLPLRGCSAHRRHLVGWMARGAVWRFPRHRLRIGAAQSELIDAEI